jgi:predicted small metal-binding protein
MRELHCGDAGLDCEGVIQAETDEEVLRQAATHAADKHPELNLDEATQAKLKSLIHDVGSHG